MTGLNTPDINLFKGMLRTHPQLVVWVALCAVILLFSGGYPKSGFFDDPLDYLPIHTSLEYFSIAVSILIFAIVWHTRDKHENSRSLFLSACFLGVAILDYMHSLSYAGMPVFVTPSSPEKAINFWLAARLLAIFALLGTAIWSWDVFRQPVWQKLLLVILATFVGCFTWVQFFYPEIFPRTFLEGSGLTPVKVITEYFISIMCLITAGIMFYRSRTVFSHYWIYLGAASLVMFCSEIFFTRYAKVTDIYNLLGHVYKVIAYSMIYRAVFVTSVREPYEQIMELQNVQTHISNQLLEAQRIANLGQWEYDTKSSKLTFSETMFQILELDLNTPPQSFDDFIQLCFSEDRMRVKQVYDNSVMDKAPFEIAYRIMLKDERIKWIRSMGITEYDENAHDFVIKGTVIDITHIMQLEDSVHSSEARFRAVVESLPVPLVIYGSDKAIIYINNSFISLLGYDLGDGILIHELISNVLPKSLSSDSLFVTKAVDAQIKCKNGILRDMLITEVSLSNNERLMFLYDLTDRKAAERAAHELRNQLAQATKMEAVGHLAAGVAHDFNNMLAAVVGYTELARQNCAINEVRNIDRYLVEVLKASERAKQLIAQMLTFSRRSPSQESEPSVILIGPVCKEVVSLLRSSMPSSIRIEYEQENQELKVRIQPVNLHQIILNLGVNARDAMGEYGKIYIRIEHVLNYEAVCASCRHSFKGEFVRLSVEDTGSGVSDVVLGKMFDPFFTTKEVGKGTGMGLSVVHGLVHAVGGHVEVKNNSDQGCVISVLLPAVDHEQNLVQDPIPVLHNRLNRLLLEGVRIMIVDDEEIVLNVLNEYLTMYGASVQAFNSSGRALSTFMKDINMFDLVITDETMPHLSGMHMSRMMLDVRPDMPIILCTGYSERAMPDVVLASGIAAFFQKPIKMHEMLEKIYQLVRKRRQTSVTTTTGDTQ